MIAVAYMTPFAVADSTVSRSIGAVMSFADVRILEEAVVEAIFEPQVEHRASFCLTRATVQRFGAASRRC